MHELGSEFGDLFASECILPSQFYDGHHRANPYQGEMRLWYEVLESALKAWQTAHTEGILHPTPAMRLRMRLELTDWFEADSYYPGSFTWLCELFALNCSAVRGRVLNHQVGSLKREMVHAQTTPLPGRGRRNQRRKRAA